MKYHDFLLVDTEKYFVSLGLREMGEDAFMRHLGHLLAHADPQNVKKIHQIWPSYWEEYLIKGVRIEPIEWETCKEFLIKETRNSLFYEKFFTKRRGDEISVSDFEYIENHKTFKCLKLRLDNIDKTAKVEINKKEENSDETR